MTTTPEQTTHPKTRSGWRTAALVLLTIALSVGVSVFVVWMVLFPTEFRPVKLSERETQVLEQKLDRIGAGQVTGRADARAPLEPEPYTEAGASREVAFTEKELNALLARNTDLAHRLAIDLSDDLMSAKLLVPLDPEFPVLGGETLKVTAGMEMRYANGRPVMILKGVSVWGVPLPNAWLGNLKNIDLVSEFGDQGGFWQAFADGIEEIEVREGKLRVKLKE